MSSDDEEEFNPQKGVIGLEGLDTPNEKNFTVSVLLDNLAVLQEPEYQSGATRFQRVVKDRELIFGDGGSTNANFPVFVCPEMKLLSIASSRATMVGGVGDDISGINKKVLQELTCEFARVAALRNDMQQNGVVEDIVDPELYPQLLLHRAFHQADKKRLDRQLADRIKEDADDDNDSNFQEGVIHRPPLAHSKIRGSYSWIPSIVAFNAAEGKATYLSPIQNLPDTAKNKNLYRLLELALGGFLKTFVEECGARRRSDGKDRYNICTKIQRYVIPPKASYKGQWHTEGVTEDVTAVGVLYTDWPAGLEGGQLKFRPPENPNEHYAEDIEPEPIRALKIEAKEGTAIAFKNELPHRFSQLTNTTDKPIVRSFVNFFVTRPDLPTTAEVPTNADIYLALIGSINYDCVWEVLTWLQFTPTTHLAASKLRASAKAEMVATKGKWGTINYGNCGQLQYLSCGGPSKQAVALLSKLRQEERTNPKADPSHKEKDPYYYYQRNFVDVIRHALTADELAELGPYFSREGLNLVNLAPGCGNFDELNPYSHVDSNSTAPSLEEK